MAINSVGGFSFSSPETRSWRFPEETDFDLELSEKKPLYIDNLDSDASDSSDESYDPRNDNSRRLLRSESNASELSDGSELSEAEIEEAEKVDAEIFNPGLMSRIKDKISANIVPITLGITCLAASLFYMGLPSEDEAKRTGFEKGAEEAMRPIKGALEFMDAHTGKKISDFVTTLINNHNK